MPKLPLYARRRVAVTGFVSAFVLSCATAPLQAQPQSALPCAACIVLVLTPGESLLIAEPLHGVELLIRGSRPDGQPFASAHVRAAMEAVRAAGGRPGLLIHGMGAQPSAAAQVDGASRIVVDVTDEGADAGDLAFRLKTRLSELRGAAPDAALGIAAPAAVVESLLTRDIAPYVDFMVRPDEPPPWPPPGAGGVPMGAVHGIEGAAGTTDAAAARWIVALPHDVVSARRLLQDVARAAPFLREGLIPGGTADVRCGQARAASYLDPGSLDTIALARQCDLQHLVVTPDVAGTERVLLAGGDVLVRVPAAEGGFAADVRVFGARTLTVREIIARHQATAARQRRDVRRLISTGTMTLTFEAPGFPAPMTITSEAVIFTAPDRVEIEQRDVRINGLAFRTGGVPRLPLLEPERVASPPLAIALTEPYRYSLAGQEAVGGTSCYVVAFEPLDRSQSLYAGRAWIAVDTFAMVRVAVVQTGLRGPILSSEQIDEFRPEGDSAWLLARSDVRQIYEGAGHRTPIHRVLAIARHEINPGEFEARRLAAYASPAIMLRDTPEGFRYLRREPGVPGGGAEVIPAVTGPARRVRTVAVGVIVDPNITRPLPFAGLSYLDFDLFGTGTQINGFFGGTYGQLAFSVPSLGGSRWQLAGRAFGIASSYNDRAFVEGREIYDANISQRPAHASVWLVRPLTPRVSTRIGYDFDYTHFGRASSTAPAFTVPAAQAAHGARLAVDGQWGGWTATAWWAGARRAGWRAWGRPDASAPDEERGEGYHPRHAAYQRAGAALGRSWVASPRLVGRIEAAWMGGRDLDRFSRYTFGSFDNRLRGYPAALIRYDHGMVVRGSAGWAVSRLLRLDGFLDSAYVRDPAFGRAFRSYTGTGTAVELPGPLGTLLALEWGYGFQGLTSDGRRGTHVIRVSGYKMF